MSEPQGTFVIVQKRGVIALPPSIRERFHLNEPGAQVEIVVRGSEIVLKPKVAIDASQGWFWTEEWQRGERLAAEQSAANEGERYDSPDEFLASLT